MAINMRLINSTVVRRRRRRGKACQHFFYNPLQKLLSTPVIERKQKRKLEQTKNMACYREQKWQCKNSTFKCINHTGNRNGNSKKP